MSLQSFGACTRLPLADCPFKRSTLTPEAAQTEIERIAGAVPWDVADAAVVLTPAPDVVVPRMHLAEIEVLRAEAERSEDVPPTKLPDTFWQRLAWLRQGGSY